MRKPAERGIAEVWEVAGGGCVDVELVGGCGVYADGAETFCCRLFSEV